MIILDKDEHILFQVRRHWFVFVVQVLSLVVLFLAPAVLNILVSRLPIDIISSTGNLISLLIFGYAAWMFILWILGFVFWTDYYLDTWIITNQKIIDVEQGGMFQREISVLHLNKIQDVTTEVSGMLATLIDYGDVYVQTAGQQRKFCIKHVPKPDEVRHKLSEALKHHNKPIIQQHPL